MKLTIFAKKLTSKDGRTFFRYITTLNRKCEDGTVEEVTTQVKFREDCGAPKGDECPMNIIVDKKDCNYREKIETYTSEDGDERDYKKKTLWISGWTKGEPYVDTSMDEFVD